MERGALCTSFSSEQARLILLCAASNGTFSFITFHRASFAGVLLVLGNELYHNPNHQILHFPPPHPPPALHHQRP
ncbi:hypothetical protein V2J09_002126 [Rumex salicifolius]